MSSTSNRSKYRAYASPESQRLKGQLAAAARNGGRTSPEYRALHRDYTASRLEDYITSLVDEAPPLTKEQKSRLVSLIRNAEVAR